MKILKTLDALLMRIIRPVIVVIGISVAMMLVIGIFSRAVLGNPVFGLEEVMLIAIMWFYMLGAALASRERSHLTTDFVQVVTKNRKVLRATALMSSVLSLVIAVLITRWSWDLLAFALERGQATPVFAIPWWVSQGSLFVASLLFVVYLLRDVCLEITGKAAVAGNPAEDKD